MLRTISRAFGAAGTKWRLLRRDDSGSVLSFLVVLPVLAGAVAVGVETGELYRVKRQMQSAADDAALSGSIDSLAGKTSSTVTSDAQYETQRNGFANGTNNVSIAVNMPPTSGANINTPGAVEVIISKTETFSFGAILNSFLGRSNSGFTMRARSVAAQGNYTSTTTSYEGCLVALTKNAEQGVSFTSFNNFNADCTIISNGGATGTGTGASVTLSSFNNATLKSIWTRGTYSATSYNHLTLTNAAQQNRSSYAVDPYSSLGTPSPGSCTVTNYVEPGGSNLTLNPGTYCGGLSVLNKSNIYFTAGTYYIANGDLVIRSDNNVSCSNCTSGAGVTFVLTQTTGNVANIGGVSITSENNITLNAPSIGTYAGVLFYQDRNASVGTMTSSAKIFTLSSLNNATLYGAIYFPNNAINISSINNSGSTSTTGCTVWIGRYVSFSSYNNNYVAGCSTYNTTPVGIATTTTVAKGKVLE